MKKVSNKVKKTNPKEFFLNKGDIIDIIAPSSASAVEELQHAILWVTQQGYVPRVASDLLEPIDYLANTDKKRLTVLKNALTNKTSKAVWCLRGGYGAIRLVPELLKLKKYPQKYFIGLSDITILHLFLNQKWNWSTIHGPVLSRTMSDYKRLSDYDELFNLLEGKCESIQFSNLKPLNTAAIKNKKIITSKIIGGNLCTFCSTLSTGVHPKVNNHFLFFEDISERGYKIDRMLNQLSQAGVFSKCKGIFFGDFIKSDEVDGKNLVWKTIERFFEKSKIPVYSGIESDHSEKQRPLFLNSKAVLSFESNKYSLKVYNK